VHWRCGTFLPARRLPLKRSVGQALNCVWGWYWGIALGATLEAAAPVFRLA
jgi:hypothetical protein